MKFIKMIVIAGIVTLFMSGCIKTKAEVQTLNIPDIKGTVTLIEKNNVKVHSYMCPENGAFVTTQIIETDESLVIVDAQFLRPYAKEVRNYIKSLNKPVERVIVSHSHPDHWFGLEYFKDIPVYSLPETADEIKSFGDIVIKSKKKVLGDLVTSETVIPSNYIQEGTTVINGLKYEFQKFMSAEAGVQLLIRLPELQIMIAQDLVYNNVHLFIGQNAFDGWIDSLEKLRDMDQYTIILSGHGEPIESDIFNRQIGYLKDTKAFFNSVDNGNDLKKNLMDKYPTYRAPVLLDISNSYLYKK